MKLVTVIYPVLFLSLASCVNAEPRPLARDSVEVQFVSQFIKPGCLVFDIGACVGFKTDQYLAAGAHKVICVDPQPLCFDSMREKYKGDIRIDVLPLAISDKLGSAQMSICHTSRQISTLSPAWQTESRHSQLFCHQWDEVIDVQMVTLNHLIAHYGVPWFCKIDVENLEYEVLCGLSQPTAYLNFEFHEETMRNAMRCVQRLQELGYDQFNFVILDSNHFALKQWVPADQIIDAITTTGRNNRFGEKLCGDIYACCTRLSGKEPLAPTEKAAEVTQYKEVPTHSIDTYIKEGDLVFDIGALIGARTDHYLSLGARVVSVEPQRIYCMFIEKRHPAEKNLVIVPKGVAQDTTPRVYYKCLTAHPLTTFSLAWAQNSRYSADYKFRWGLEAPASNPTVPELLPMTTLDLLIVEHGRPRYCKICVCNFEYEVLAGLTAPIEYLSFEFHKEFAERIGYCLARLKRLGYTKFNFTLGSDTIFALPDWINGDEIIQTLVHDAGQKNMLDTFCGEIYAWCPTA